MDSDSLLADTVTNYLAQLATHASPATVAAYRQDLSAFCQFAEQRGITQASALDTALVRAFLGAERSRGFSQRFPLLFSTTVYPITLLAYWVNMKTLLKSFTQSCTVTCKDVTANLALVKGVCHARSVQS